MIRTSICMVSLLLPPCPNCNVLQNFLRCQNNKTNYNLVCETLQFLDCICGSTTGGLGLLGLYINEKNVALINQTLESLTEYCQGPCHENQVMSVRSTSLPPCACNMRSAGLSPQPAQLVLSCRAAHFACLTKGIWLCFITFYLHSTGHRMGGITISRYNYMSLQSNSITGQDCSLKLASCCQFVHVSYMPFQKQGFRASTKVVENCILSLDTSKVGVVWHI